MTKLPADRSTELEPYTTSDTPFAAYLHLCGIKLVGTRQDPNDYKREVVVFIKEDEIEVLEKQWRLNEASGPLKQYHRSLKIINRKVNEARRKRDD